MTVGYGEATFPRHLAQVTGWLVAAYQVGYGLAAFGAGAIQGTVSLVDEFRVAAVCGLIMAGFAVPIVRSQHREIRSTPTG
jgi:predicted MFS family arabinose efflux permease